MEYLTSIFTGILQLLVHDGKNGSDHLNYSLLEKEYKTQHKRKLFFLTVDDHKCKMFTIRFRKLEPDEGETVYTVAMEQLDQYFTPQVNVP